MMAEVKMCPLFVAAGQYPTGCLKEGCAWFKVYNPNTGYRRETCAIPDIAGAIVKLSDKQ